MTDQYDPDREAAEAFHASQEAEGEARRRARERDAADWVREAGDLGFPLGVPQRVCRLEGRGRVSVWLLSSPSWEARCQRVTGYQVGAYVVHKSHLRVFRSKWLISHVATGMFIRHAVWENSYTDDQRLVEHGVADTKRAAMALARGLPALLADQPFGLRDVEGFKIGHNGTSARDVDAVMSALVVQRVEGPRVVVHVRQPAGGRRGPGDDPATTFHPDREVTS